MKRVLLMAICSAATLAYGVVMGPRWPWFVPAGGGAPATTNGLIRWYQLETSDNPALDSAGSGQSAPWGGLTFTSATNGRSGYATWDAGDALTCTVAQVSIGAWANTSTVYRYYELIGGTSYVDRVAQAGAASVFVTNGSTVVFGTNAMSADELCVWDHVLTPEESWANMMSNGVRIGMMSAWDRDNFADYTQNVMLAVNMNNMFADSSTNRAPFSSTDYPTLINSGKTKGATDYNGSTDDVQYNSVGLSLNGTTTMTAMVWIKFDANWPYGSGYRNLLTGRNYNFQFNFNAATGTGEFYVKNAVASWVGVVSAKTTWISNTWWHVAGTYDGVKQIYYVNGQPNKTNTVTMSIVDYTTPTPLIVGAYSQSLQEWNDKIGEARLLRNAATAVEILNYYNATTNDYLP